MSETILIVDDEFPLRLLLRDNLELEDFQVVEAGSGKEALELAWDKKPSAAIIDVGLPDMTGWEVCRRLKSDPRSKGLPLIVLTAATGPRAEEHKAELEIEHCLAKPYEPGDVVQLLRAVLAKRG